MVKDNCPPRFVEITPEHEEYCRRHAVMRGTLWRLEDQKDPDISKEDVQIILEILQKTYNNYNDVGKDPDFSERYIGVGVLLETAEELKNEEKYVDSALILKEANNQLESIKWDEYCRTQPDNGKSVEIYMATGVCVDPYALGKPDQAGFFNRMDRIISGNMTIEDEAIEFSHRFQQE